MKYTIETKEKFLNVVAVGGHDSRIITCSDYHGYLISRDGTPVSISEELLEQLFNEGIVERVPNGTFREGPPWDYWITYYGRRCAAMYYYNLQEGETI